MDQVVARIAEDYPRQVADLLNQALERGLDGVLDVLFPDEQTAADADIGPPPEWDAVVTAVVSTAPGRYPQAKQRVAQMMAEIVECSAAALRQL